MLNNENLTKQGYNLVQLIKALLNKTKPILTEPNFKEIYQLAKMHSIENMLFYAINHYQSYGVRDVNIDVLKQLTKEHLFAISRTATQEAELEILEKNLENEGINYSLLKGSILKYMYPSVDMRSMSDIDIYFDKTKAAEVKRLMLSLGYRIDSYNRENHDCYLKDPFMNLEMHRELVHDRFEFSSYYDNYWKNLKKNPDKNFKYDFSDEDYYLYLIAHGAKHCANGGTGIRTVIDQYIYLENKKDSLDREYLKNELDKLGLSLYEENLTKLAYFWFGNDDVEKKYDDWRLKKEHDLMLRMSNFIFNSGTYGTVHHSILNDFIGEKQIKNLNASKFKNLFRLAFPSFSFMKERNPILRKLPFLLPWFYFTRFLKGIFRVKDDTSVKISTTANVTKEEIEEHKKTKEDIGI